MHPRERLEYSPIEGRPPLRFPDGMRVGFWRLKKLLQRLGPTPTVTLNAKVCETYPQVVKACIEAGWELNAHSYDQVPMHKLDDQRAVIRKSVDLIEKFSGK